MVENPTGFGFSTANCYFSALAALHSTAQKYRREDVRRGAGRDAPRRQLSHALQKPKPYGASIAGLVERGSGLGHRELPRSTAALQGQPAGVVWRENECQGLIFPHKMLLSAITPV